MTEGMTTVGLAKQIQPLITKELEVDRIHDDVTAKLLGPDNTECAAIIRNREGVVFAGEAIVEAFRLLFPREVRFETFVKDGSLVPTNTDLVRMQTNMKLCLSLERTLLNYLSFSSGVATLTRKYVDLVKPLPVKILATRKTIPGLREIQLRAVQAGGGYIHRRSLSDGILIKDNHVAIRSQRLLLEEARLNRSPLHRIELEVQNLEALKQALETPPDIVMLDNFTIDEIKKAVQLIAGRCEIEVSGGVNLNTVRAIAEQGVNYISVGALTHSAPSVNLSMDIID